MKQLVLGLSVFPKRRGGCCCSACRSRLSCPLNPLEPLTQPLRHVLDQARRVHVLRDSSSYSPACTSSRGDAPSGRAVLWTTTSWLLVRSYESSADGGCS